MRLACGASTFRLVFDDERGFPGEEPAWTFFRRLRNAVAIVPTSTCLLNYHAGAESVNGRGGAVIRNAQPRTPVRERDADLMIPRGWLKLCRLTATSLSALNELRQNHEFEDGAVFLENVLHVLLHLEKLTPALRRLRRQLEAIPFTARESLSIALTSAQVN